MALLVAYSPDVWQTEKPMDMAFLNASGDARHFPPEDPWMAGEDLNYYYLGHLMAAGLVRLSGVAPDVGYNLAVAAFFALSVVAAFGLALRARRAASRPGCGAWRCASWRARSAPGSSSSHDGGPLRAYDWFGASRVIEGTINEFPAFSFTLARPARARDGDPVLAARARVRAPARDRRPGAAAARAGGARARRGGDRDRDAVRDQRLVVPGRSRGLVALGALVRMRDGADAARARAHARMDARGARCSRCIAVLPFLLTYDPAADGFGTRLRARVVHAWARDHGALYGLFAYLVFTAYAVRLARSRHPWRTAGWAAAAALFVGSLLAADNLTGVGALVALCWVAAHAAFVSRAPAVERFVWVLIGGGLLCLADPGGDLRQRLLRRRRPLPHEHGLQARLPGVAAAGDRGRAR